MGERRQLNDRQAVGDYEANRDLWEGAVIGRRYLPFSASGGLHTHINNADNLMIPVLWDCDRGAVAARQGLGVEPVEIPGGHCPFLSRPGHLAEALERCS